MRIGSWLALFAFAAMPCLAAEPPRDGRDVIVRLTDGSILVGRIVTEDERRLRVVTGAGVDVEVPRSAVASIQDAAAHAAAKDVGEHVVDDTRLFFGPTGRPLSKGAGYFSDHSIFLPGVAYGITDNITLAGGMSLVPTVPLDDQAFYFTPKVGARLGDRAALSVGGLLMGVGGGEGDGGTVTVGYAVGTWGTSERSLTAGVGLGRASADGETSEAEPMVMVAAPRAFRRGSRSSPRTGSSPAETSRCSPAACASAATG